MKAALGILGDLCVIGAALAVAFVSLNPRSEAARRSDPVKVDVNASIALPGVDFATTSRTLILVANSNCKYCAKSLPFYRRIAETAKTRAGDFRFVVVGPEPEAVLGSYLRDNGVQADQIIEVTAAETPSLVTPTLILVNGQSKVQAVWRGLQSSASEEAILKKVS